MKLNEVLAAAPENKLKKLKAVITPKNIAQHYDVVMNALALKVPMTDIDTIIASLTGANLDPEEEEFQLELAEKTLKSLNTMLVKKNGEMYLKGNLPKIDEDPPSSWPLSFNFIIYRNKGMWEAKHDKVGWRVGSSSKRFEKINDAVEYIKKQGARHEKKRVEFVEKAGKKNEGI